MDKRFELVFLGANVGHMGYFKGSMRDMFHRKLHTSLHVYDYETVYFYGYDWRRLRPMRAPL